VRLLQIALLGAIVALALTSPAEARDCHRSGTTVSANQSARLFYVGVSGDHKLYACWLPTGRVRSLGALNLGETGPDSPVLAGRYVAYDRILCIESGVCSGRVVVRDVETGERLHQAPAQSGVVGGIVLTRGGVAAWTRGGVYKLDAGGVTALDGPVADQRSLALAGTIAYWMRGETPVSADLGGTAAPAPVARGRAKDCRIRGRTVAADARVRIFAVDKRFEPYGELASRYYACDVARRRTHLLGSLDFDYAGGVSPYFGLAGGSVLYEDVYCDDKLGACTGEIDRLDVRRRFLHRIAVSPGPPYTQPSSALALTSDLNAVRVVSFGLTLYKGRVPTTLDVYPNVGKDSLAVAGKRIYWTSAGAPRTALP
jgi:hypothetical protein